jgi:hypothetical protein
MAREHNSCDISCNLAHCCLTLILYGVQLDNDYQNNIGDYEQDIIKYYQYYLQKICKN